MLSPSKLERFKVSKEELASLAASFNLEALPLLEKLFIASYWILLDYKLTRKIIKQTFLEAIEFCNVTKNQADWQSWIYRIWMREINELYEKRENDTQTNFEFIDYAEVGSLSQINLPVNIPEIGNVLELKILLEKIPAVLRIPLILKENLSLKYEKIAELIDVPIGVIATRIFRARRLLFLFARNKLHYEDEKKKWTNRESTKRIFELRQCTLSLDDELPTEQKYKFSDSLDSNPELDAEFSVQKQIKSQLQNIKSARFPIKRLRIKIERRAKKKFGWN